MAERRGKRKAQDAGARTRSSDHGDTPHSLGDWITTFQLRWVEHLTKAQNGGAQAA
jgi:hypothetical protein